MGNWYADAVFCSQVTHRLSDADLDVIIHPRVADDQDVRPEVELPPAAREHAPVRVHVFLQHPIAADARHRALRALAVGRGRRVHEQDVLAAVTFGSFERPSTVGDGRREPTTPGGGPG